MRRCFFCFSIFLLSFPVYSYNQEKFDQDFSALSLEEQSTFMGVAGSLKCPTCVALGILESNTPFSLSMREKVIQLVKEDKSEEEIRDFFTDRYGEWLLRAPPKEGVHLLLWVLPVLFLLSFVFILFFLVIRRNESRKRKEHSVSIEEMFETDLALFERGK